MTYQTLVFDFDGVILRGSYGLSGDSDGDA